MCVFTRWAATGIMIDTGAFADLTAQEGTTRSRPTMMLTLIGSGTCPGPGWFHSLVRAEDAVGRGPKVAVFRVTSAGPSDPGDGSLPPMTSIVDWTGPISPEAERVEVLEARREGGPTSVEIDVRW